MNNRIPAGITACGENRTDCDLANLESQAFHQAVGFREANRIVTYVRELE